jgi:hypothetical protein
MANVSDSPFSANTSGEADVDLIGVGRGFLLAAKLDDDDEPDGDGEFDLGEIPELTIEPSSEFIEHYSSRNGFRNLDKKILIQQKFDVRFRAQERNLRNAEIFFAAEAEAYTNPTIAGFVEHVMIAAVKLGRWYPIKNAAGVHARGIASADLLLEKDAATDVTLVEGTDYELDEAAGMVRFLTTATNIAEGNAVNATLTANPLADSTQRVPVQSVDGQWKVALRFIGTDPETGRKFELYIPKITLAADGSMPLITSGEEWMSLGFTGAAEKKDADTAIAYLTPLPEGGVT